MRKNKLHQITKAKVAFYKRQGYVKIKDVFNPLELALIEEKLDLIVLKEKSTLLSLEKRDTYGKAFIQLGNLWGQDQAVKAFVYSKHLAHIAKQLMEVKSVRLYHDQLLYKEPSGGITPWHCDQQYWPLASDKTVTAWIPLQATPLEMGPLEFSSGSHQLIKGRNLEIGDESEKEISNILRLTDFKQQRSSFDLGEVSFHSGWIFHRAGANKTNKTRKVMTVIYMDSEMELKSPDNENQTQDWEKWCPGARIGEIIDSPLNPILFP
ncbi:phytanoyl-CoA dioxygenase family protein [Flavobacteriaceae bacterium]|nr:phytanoyl-CoA dioxygenase family protein [Flavobacteriaceae bacterium]|tara:strand:- start:837 stop:1634 length:798 start_codon:yes stop_codon:yes gene_type:complete